MVIRMRIYESQDANHAEADRVFYHYVKPVHEAHGAIFRGRYKDEFNRIVVMWAYKSKTDLQRIQKAVAQDPETQKHKKERLKHGLHGFAFQEIYLRSTEPNP